MTQKRGMKRFLLLLEILHQMSNEKDYTLLNDKIMPYQLITKNKDKLEKVFTFLEENYHKPIEIESIAKLTNMTLPAFCNFFKKTTHLTFTEYLNRYRVDKACKLLAEDYSISDVAYMVGFNSVSYFNRNFNKFLNESPTNFKKTIKR
ncbi:helix-turn-helix domain-containing protein [Riemerella anatipestifer]|nr:AraC family transcriptional regulator [Riemerella anatipestifer]MCE3023438.1 AraC family transcriptional regulator [Riemerella anatipestifer]MCU7559226.1 AraC family transcriptional regulator [Riemerella anatipestifer]MDD1540318.1 helix-turn-helix transcriptional regulator [Riemerella anatipestifer]MDY3402960.1 AraC family transcriptional regulator [Riemerella anatipestifer]MDY3448398.1 AraC family transcriptional regulator [Riemerella anatipestifer]